MTLVINPVNIMWRAISALMIHHHFSMEMHREMTTLALNARAHHPHKTSLMNHLCSLSDFHFIYYNIYSEMGANLTLESPLKPRNSCWSLSTTYHLTSLLGMLGNVSGEIQGGNFLEIICVWICLVLNYTIGLKQYGKNVVCLNS